jgi:hypothetical protein
MTLLVGKDENKYAWLSKGKQTPLIFHWELALRQSYDSLSYLFLDICRMFCPTGGAIFSHLIRIMCEIYLYIWKL